MEAKEMEQKQLWFRLHCDYYKRGHLDKVDESDYKKKKTIHSENNHNYYETKSFKRDRYNQLKKAYVSWEAR